MVGVTISKRTTSIAVLNFMEIIRKLIGALPATELIEDLEVLRIDVDSVRSLLSQIQQKLERIPPEELLNKFLSVVPDTASEESYNETIEKLERVYKELFPVEISMMERFRESSTPEVKKQVWNEVYRPIAVNLAESFAEESAKLWDYAFDNEGLSDEEIEKLDLVNSWLFLLTKVFAISSRMEDSEKAVELSRFGVILYLRGVKIFREPNLNVNEAKEMLKQDFKLIVRKITAGVELKPFNRKGF
ncbi:hypothetical protein [Thermococcus sp.]|uniref:hypothetical protein n=1 Tax=Thermococcus sp. TaxID=35749 RepID=UPI0026325159|nr:hypothetical protein [Thermococcus sp.]